MARQSIVGEKSVAFAKRVAKCYRYLLEKKKESVASYQFYKSGTSIGANVREGLFAQSRKDFISKMNIALKEAGETDYWLEILKNDNDELIKMLSSIIKTTKENTPKSPKNS